MMTDAAIPLDQEIQVPRSTYSLKYSPRLVRTTSHLPEGYETAGQGSADFYDALKIAAVMALVEGRPLSLPDANEEQYIYLQKSGGAERLRDVGALKDYFANNDKNWYAFGETLTGLRFHERDLRKPYNVGDKITAEIIITDIPEDIRRQIADPKFTRDSFKDIVGKINRIEGVADVPYARGHVIREMRNGIFTEVEPTTEHWESYALHGWLRENLDIPKDPISGHYDVAVGRWSGWLHGEWCLSVAASCRRSGADSVVGFRPVVRGSVPERKIDIVSTDADIEKIRKELMLEVASDLRQLTSPDLLEKYKS